jgi:hypothetical protein
MIIFKKLIKLQKFISLFFGVKFLQFIYIISEIIKLLISKLNNMSQRKRKRHHRDNF